MRKIESEPDFVRATLDWCNERRAEKGKEPLERLPKGKRHDGNSCPCGRAIDKFVGYYSVYEGRGGQPVCRVPEVVQDFISSFDWGYLPQYEEVIS